MSKCRKHMCPFTHNRELNETPQERQEEIVNMDINDFNSLTIMKQEKNTVDSASVEK